MEMRFGKIVTLFVIAAFALATPAMAQKAEELKAAHKMMADGWKQFNDGQRMVSRARR